MSYRILSLEDKTVASLLFKMKLVINCGMKFDLLKLSTCNTCAGFCTLVNLLDFGKLTNVFNFFCYY